MAQALSPAAPALMPALVWRAARAIGFHPPLCAAQGRIVTRAGASLAACAGLLLTPLLLTAQPLDRYERSEPVMGTQARIAVYAPTAGIAKDAFDAAFARIRELDNLLSDYKPDSELNRLCSATPGTMHKVSGDLIVILEHARRLSEDTDGAFDITVGPLTRLWRKARNERRLPTPDEIETARGSTGFRKVTIDLESQSVALSTAGMQLDLGGIAKGYAADAAREVLRNLGMERALVAIGGDICLGGAPPEQRGWRIGIQSMDNVATLARTCVSTSGDTEQYVEIDGVRYSHILDPRTGIGLRHRAMVTVRAPEGMLADSLATALSVLPPEDRRRLLRKYPAAKLY